MNPEIMIAVGIGGVVLATILLGVKEYNSELNGPRRIGRNWFATEIPSEWRDSKYKFTNSDRSRRTVLRNQLDPRNDYEAISYRPSGGWLSGGKSKRKTKRK